MALVARRKRILGVIAVVRIAGCAVDSGLGDCREVAVAGLVDARFVVAIALDDLGRARSVLRIFASFQFY